MAETEQLTAVLAGSGNPSQTTHTFIEFDLLKVNECK